jgi:hypothetical protein
VPLNLQQFLSYNINTGKQSITMEVIQTFPNGSTIEFGEDWHGNQVHRVCNASASMCRYAEPYHVALTYAQQYEEYFKKV